MPRGRLIGALFLLLSLVLAGLILTDAWPYLRGPAPGTGEWHWPYLLRPFARWWPSLLGATALGALATYWDKKAPGRAWPLLGVVAITIGLQLAIIYAERPNVGAELVDRTLSKDTSGYAAVAGEIDDLNAVLREYPELMPTFDNEHARTHPPGLVAAHWLADRAFRAWPDLAQFVARPAQLWRCTDLWVIARPPGTIAALLVGALLPVLAAGLVPWAAYRLARRLYDERTARWSALFSAAIPALLIFAPTPDQLFALLSLLSLWLIAVGVLDRRVHWLALGGIALSLMTMLSIGNAAWVFVVVCWLALVVARGGRPWRDHASGLAAFVVGLTSFWVIYWIGWGVAPWEIILTGLDQHRQLVTDFRSYPLWLLYNPLDFTLFAGPAVVAGLALQAIRSARRREARRPPAGPLPLILAFALVALDLSGGTRGEVGRLWLVFMPLTAIVAAAYWTDVMADRPSLLLLLASQLTLAVAIGLAWQPIRAVILPVAPPDFPVVPASMSSSGIAFEAASGRQLTLDAFDIVQNPAPPSIDVTLAWRSNGPTSQPYTVFVHVLDEDGDLLAQQDGWPVDGAWPTTCWAGEESVIDSRHIPLPDDVAPGVYTIITGLYDGTTGARLTAENGLDHIRLGQITLEP